MNLANERKLAARAKALGESADAGALGELAEMTRSASPLVRRLAASAIGKLAGIVDAEQAVELLTPLLADTHPQARQYAAKALSAYGPAAESALPALRDMMRNPAEKDYVKRSVETAGKTIRAAVEVADKQTVRTCSRCGQVVEPDEYDVYIEYWGMDTPRYKAGMYLKQDLYMHAGKRLISLYPADKRNLDQALGGKLAQLKAEGGRFMLPRQKPLQCVGRELRLQRPLASLNRDGPPLELLS